MVAVDLADVQGFILRGYNMPVGRYHCLTVREPGAARIFLGKLTDNDPTVPVVTSAQPWVRKPACCVNVGITFPGLAALGVSPSSLGSFPREYREGAVQRARSIGDVGPSSPRRWLPWLVNPGLHVLVSLYAQCSDALEATTRQLQRAWFPGWVELGRHDGAWMPGTVEHFGYCDDISQPTIDSVPFAGLPDRLPQSPVGQFLLGYPSQHVGFNYPMPEPLKLGMNGSFAAFRVLEQDVNTFTRFLTEQAAATGMSTEFIAAKLCGRWRNGTPLALSPETEHPPSIAPGALNDFDYNADKRGYRCPAGSHIRRMYPRGARVAGNGSHLHRIVRRGIPYGPPYDPTRPRDGQARGLLGLFIGVSLRDQFEFLMTQWANGGTFTAGLGRSNDPLIGAHTDGPGSFSIPRPEGPLVLQGLARFVTTRGGAYCFLPSLTGIRYLAGLG